MDEIDMPSGDFSKEGPQFLQQTPANRRFTEAVQIALNRNQSKTDSNW